MNVKNTILFVILTCLIAFAYFYEEIGKEKKNIVSVEKKSLIKSFSSINEISFDGLDILKQNKAWVIPNEKRSLSLSRVTEIMNVFSGIEIEATIIKREKLSSYFRFQKIEVEFRQGKVIQKIALGDVSELTGNFYILLNDKDLFICSDKSLLDTPYKTELDLKLRKYLRLKRIMTSEKFQLINKNILYNYDLDQISKIKIDGRRNRWFELNLIKNITLPLPYSGVETKKLKEYVIHLLNKFKIKKRMSFNPKLVYDEMGTIEFYINNAQTELKLYSSYNGVFGRYLYINGSKELFELETVSKNLFYMNIQDFWIKTFIFNVDMVKINNFGFELSTDNNKYYAFGVSDAKNKFSITSLSKNVDFEDFKMNFMFNLIFNLVDFKEAKYIEDKIDLELDRSHLYIKIFNKKLSILKNKNLITVTDHSLRIKYYFNYNSQPLADSFFQTIFTVGQK
jgi:hypothetical protein